MWPWPDCLDSSWPPLSNGGHNNVLCVGLWVQWGNTNNMFQQCPVTHGSNKCDLLLSYTQCFWASNIIGPDAPFNSGNLCDALLLLPCPPPPPHANIHLSSQKIFRGDWILSFPNEETKRPKSACPHWVCNWQRFEVVLRHRGEQLKITLSGRNASKLCAGVSHPGEHPRSATSRQNHTWPWQDGISLTIPYGT